MKKQRRSKRIKLKEKVILVGMAEFGFSVGAGNDLRRGEFSGAAMVFTHSVIFECSKWFFIDVVVTQIEMQIVKV
jgi:hypothetical protein